MTVLFIRDLIEKKICDGCLGYWKKKNEFEKKGGGGGAFPLFLKTRPWIIPLLCYFYSGDQSALNILCKLEIIQIRQYLYVSCQLRSSSTQKSSILDLIHHLLPFH